MHHVLFMGGVIDGRIQVLQQLPQTLTLDSATAGEGHIYHKKETLGAFTIYQSADAKNNYANSLIDAYIRKRLIDDYRRERPKARDPILFSPCELHTEVVNILSDYAQLRPHLIVGTAHFTQLGMDSLDKIEALLHLEEHFNVEITEQAAEKIKTVDDLVNLIRAQR